jgi:hypothetical protein
MPKRVCVSCTVPLTNDNISREHILPEWVAAEVHQPELSLKHYRHNEDAREDELLRSHDLGSFAIKNVCQGCNNGWMSDLEGSAKPILLGLMNMKTSLLQLAPDERSVISAWAIKTAFMITSAQKTLPELPWPLFRGLASKPQEVPIQCIVVAAQLPFLPKSFLYACPADHMAASEALIHVRVGFSINKLHFVVVIPFLEAERIVRTSGVQLPLWPLDLEIRVAHKHFPTLTSPNDLINFLTGLVEVGVVSDSSPHERVQTR